MLTVFGKEKIMLNFEYYSPTKIVFGKDTEGRTAELVKKCGGTRVLIVYGGNSVIKNGLLSKVEKNLADNKIEYLSIGGVAPNPLLSKVREIIKAGLEYKTDFILAIGGGSVLDTAKAAAHGIASPDIDVWDYWLGKAKVERSLNIGSVLTISAAGSETSNSAVITNDEVDKPTKRGISTDFNRPKFAIMNPELTMTLPKWQIGAGAADIYMHTSERFFTDTRGNHLTDEIALGLMRNIIKYGVIGYNNPTDYEAMSEIMWSGSISHIGLTGLGADGDWSNHQLGMAISAVYDSTHGATLTAVWGSWARYVLETDIARFADYGAKVFGLSGDDKEVALSAIAKTEEFFKAIGMPLTLTELLGHKPSEEEIADIVRECTFNHSRSIGRLRTLAEADIKKIYEMAV